MAYSTSQEVQEEFKEFPISATTAIKADQVTRFIEEADAEIDARLAIRFEVPITSEDALPLIRKISIGLVAGRIKNMLPIQTGDTGIAQSAHGLAGRLEKEARELLRAIVDQEMKLIGVNPATTHQGVKSGNVSANVRHRFKRDQDQW